jgi:solute:Na+ symporter, SSS family
MIANLNVTATAVFVLCFLLVTVLGFAAARWKAGDLDQLHEWGLGGRRFGFWITWFLMGGDLYTAYTVIAVPALVYALGAYGFFAVPYATIAYPLMFLALPKLWSVAHKKGYVTGADFVLGRYGNKPLEIAVAITGIVATMPYIALQLVGMEKVIQALGLKGEGLLEHLPLTIAFAILAFYTYKSGLRAPAMIAFVKDVAIYIFVIAAIIIIPAKLGGYAAVFDAADVVLRQKVAASGGKLAAGLVLTPTQVAPFITLAIGSALALFMYPHSLTGALSASSSGAVKRNAIALPAYSFLLGLVALLGLMALAAGIDVANPQDAVPQLFLKMFPDWFVGFAFAGIAIGALVPAAVMSIGAANTFTRNIWKPFVQTGMTDVQESRLAKITSLVVKLGALAVIYFAPTRFAIDLQLLGGVWMSQILPAIVFGLYTRWFSGWALFQGWLLGMVLGTWLVWGPTLAPVYPLFPGFGIYAGLIAVCANIAAATLLSAVLPNRAPDQTTAADYRSSRAAVS